MIYWEIIVNVNRPTYSSIPVPPIVICLAIVLCMGFGNAENYVFPFLPGELGPKKKPFFGFWNRPRNCNCHYIKCVCMKWACDDIFVNINEG